MLLKRLGKLCETLQGEKFLAVFQHEDVENIAQDAIVGQEVFTVLTDKDFSTGDRFNCNEKQFEIINYGSRDVRRTPLGTGPKALQLNKFSVVECLTAQ